MLIAVKQSFKNSKTVKKTINLKGLQISGINCNINGYTSMTMMCWVMIQSGTWHFEEGPGWYEAGGWGGTYFVKNADTMEIRFGTGSSVSKKQFPCVFPYNEWHHYCFTRGSGLYKFFIDGNLAEIEASETDSSTKNNSDIFYLSGAWGQGNPVQNCDLSFARYALFSRELTESEILLAYSSEIDTKKAPFNDGLILGLNVTEGKGDKIYDIVSGQYASISTEPNWDVQFNP